MSLKGNPHSADTRPVEPVAVNGSSNGLEPIVGAGWRKPLPRRGPVDRAETLVDLARGRRVVHVGFVDEGRMADKVGDGRWLHGRLADVASALIGIDVSEDGVRWARQRGYEAYAVDAQSGEAVAGLGLDPADVVIAGEVIEHLDAPGPFLRAMRELLRPEGVLVVTTPNAYRLLNFLAPVAGIELIHPDHTAWHSPHTLRNLLERNGWQVEGMAYYQNPAPRIPWNRNFTRRAAARAVLGARALFARAGRLLPYWSDGLVVWSRPLVETDGR
jgi:SAM-dependent methyltransferase